MCARSWHLWGEQKLAGDPRSNPGLQVWKKSEQRADGSQQFVDEKHNDGLPMKLPATPFSWLGKGELAETGRVTGLTRSHCFSWRFPGLSN